MSVEEEQLGRNAPQRPRVATSGEESVIERNQEYLGLTRSWQGVATLSA